MKTYRQKMGFAREEIIPLPAPTPRLMLSKQQHNGHLAIRVTVVCNTELIGVTDGLGYEAVINQANHRTILCMTPAELDAARNPIMPYFNHDGEYTGYSK